MNDMLRLPPIAIVIILLLMPAYSQQRTGKTFSPSVGPAAVWNPSEAIQERLYSCCNKPCFASIMRKAKASEQAIAFSRSIEFEGWLTSFSEMGRIDVATAYYVCMVNSNAKVLLLNGTPPIIDTEVEGVSDSLDRSIVKDPLYAELVKRRVSMRVRS